MRRKHIKAGQIIGCTGYTDLKVQKDGKSLTLFSTEGGDLDFYEEALDTHHKVKFDMDGNSKTNKNFGRMYYEL